MDQILHSKAVQLVPALLSATMVTFALFWVMLTLIESSGVELNPPPIVITEFVRLPKETLVPASRPRPQPVPEPEVVPPSPPVSFLPTNITSAIQPTESVVRPGLVVETGLSDGPYLPLVKVQPTYPRTALSRGIEGYTIVEFDVGPDGSVRNPRIIESYPSGIFNESSLRAVMKFRYKPTVENGIPVFVTGVQNRFTFELTDIPGSG